MGTNRTHDKISENKWKCNIQKCQKEFQTPKTIHTHLHNEHIEEMMPEPEEEKQCTYCNITLKNMQELLEHVHLKKQKKRDVTKTKYKR